MSKKLNFLVILFISLVYIFNTSCEKSTNIGFDLIPKKYIFTPEVQDSFTVQAYTYRVDSIITSGVPKALLGTYIDPVFGDVRASFVTQMRPESTTIPKEPTAVLDSVYLYLKYDTTYSTQYNSNQIAVYEITEKISDTIKYYSNTNPNSLNPLSLISANYNPAVVKSGKIIYGTDTIESVLAVKLPKEFGDRLFDAGSWDTTTFSNIFEGLYIEPNAIPYNGDISSFDLRDKDSKITLYYQDDTEDSLRFNFDLVGYGARFNIFEHVHEAPGFLPDLDNPESIQDSVVYLQGAAGLDVRIKIPYLDKLREVKGLYVVNRAELIISAAPKSLTSESLYPAPEQMALYLINEEDKYEGLIEYYGQTGYLGSSYDAVDGQYFFDITYVVQKIVKGELKYKGFALSVGDGAINPARVVLTSGNHSNKIKFNLILTKL